MLALPLNAGAHGLALLTMIGGLSAATGMVVVDSVALAITVSNDLVMPLLLRRRGAQARAARATSARACCCVRRVAILGVLALGYRLRAARQRRRVSLSIGLLSFAARGADRAGLSRRPVLAARHRARRRRRHDARASLVWFYLLFLPSTRRRQALSGFLAHGPLGDRLAAPGGAGRALRPIRWSAASLCRSAPISRRFVAFSLTRQADAARAHAGRRAFVGAAPGGKPQAFRLWRASTTAGELEATVARYLGAGAGAPRLRRASCASAASLYGPSDEADAHLIRHAEHPAVAGDRRLDLASGAVAAAAPARDVGQVGAQADRRRLGGDPVEPRSACSTRSITRARASRCSTPISR